MYRIILVDDEPLILAGIASLLCWEEHDCSIVGKATNGPAAVELICSLKPDIVITDIRMPVMNGLELIEACRERGCEFAFIFLTNLEDFQLAKQAVHLGAVDYLVKLDLEPADLIQALNNAKECCARMESHHKKELYTLLLKDSREQLERNYFTQLIMHAPEGALPADSEIAARYPLIRLILAQMKPERILFGQTDTYDFHFIRSQLLDVISGITARYFKSSAILTPQQDTLLLIVAPGPESSSQKALSDFCGKINVALSTYFALTALFGISREKTALPQLPEAYFETRTALEHCYYDSASPVSFYENQKDIDQHPAGREFNINFLKRSMSAAVLENESEELRAIFRELSELFTQYKPDKTQAVSACINIYSYLHDLFRNEDPEGSAFPYSIDIAQQLRCLGSLDDVLLWLDSFCEKMCALLSDRKENRSDRLVYMTKRYIHEHYTEKLTLSDISEHLGISSGHLSSTFSRYMNRTVSDYIAEVKIEHAKELIAQGQYLIYEIADQLGFENAYYFSKVFKKITGMSPKNYECLHKLNSN